MVSRRATRSSSVRPSTSSKAARSVFYYGRYADCPMRRSVPYTILREPAPYLLTQNRVFVRPMDDVVTLSGIVLPRSRTCGTEETSALEKAARSDRTQQSWQSAPPSGVCGTNGHVPSMSPRCPLSQQNHIAVIAVGHARMICGPKPAVCGFELLGGPYAQHSFKISIRS